MNIIVLPKNYEQAQNNPALFPDYKEITVPPNIAPLNFCIENDSSKKQIAVFSVPGQYSFKVKSRNQKFNIAARKWKKLLKAGKGKSYTVEIYTKSEKEWIKYKTFENRVAEEVIDSYISFRHINAGYILWEKMGIYQRNLESFRKTPVLLNDRTNTNCMNCHTFGNYNPNEMMIHLRRPPSGTLLCTNGETRFLNTATDYTMSAGVYPSWHPNRNLIAYSVNRIAQKFHSAGEKLINVYDMASDIVVYDIKKNMITTTPALSTKSLENLPAWSPCGNYLYYISSPPYSAEANAKNVKYDMLRIKYNAAENKWGTPDTLLRSSDTGLSITYPAPSPDGKFLSFCMATYGYFTIHNPTTDVYLLDLETKEYSKLPVNSNHVESFHAWSSNGRWLMFVSKRLDKLYSRVYFAHIDKNGKASKPFLLPQKDPGFYSTFTINYNRPVFMKDKVRIKAGTLSKTATEKHVQAKFDPNIDVNALSGATQIVRDVHTEHTN